MEDTNIKTFSCVFLHQVKSKEILMKQIKADNKIVSVVNQRS